MTAKVRPEQLPFTPLPAERCRLEWKCYACGASAQMLKHIPSGGPHHVYCRVCGMRYELSLPAEGKKTRYAPKPFQSLEGCRVWKRAWLHFQTAPKTLAFMDQHATPAEANNAMNRLDGGIIPDGR